MQLTKPFHASKTSGVRSAFLFSLLMMLWFGHFTSMAADWFQLDRNADGDTLSIDRGSIERDGVLVKFTEHIIFTKPRQTQRHGLLKSLRTRYSMNCMNQTNAPLLLEAITSTGDVVGLSEDSMAKPEFISISPNSRAPDRIAFNYLCARR